MADSGCFNNMDIIVFDLLNYTSEIADDIPMSGSFVWPNPNKKSVHF